MGPMPLLFAGAGALGNALNVHAQYRQARHQVKQINRNLERAATTLEHQAVGEGVNQQAAYDWAGQMIRKYAKNAAAMEGAVNLAGQRLESSTQRAMQLRAGAQELLAKRLAMPKKPGIAEYGAAMVSGGATGFLLGKGMLKQEDNEPLTGLLESLTKNKNGT